MKIDITKINNVLIENNISYSSNLTDGDILDSISSINNAKSNSLIFLFNKKYLSALSTSKAKCCVLKNEFIDHLPKNIKYITVDDPYLALATLSNLFYKKRKSNGVISKYANLDKNVQIENQVQIDALSNIYENSIINNNVIIQSNCTIGPNVLIGKNTLISSNSSISNCIIGENSVIKSGVVIGSEGFGFEINSKKRIKH